MGVQIPQEEVETLGVVRPTEKHSESLLQFTEPKINNGISATAAADCIAADGPVSY